MLDDGVVAGCADTLLLLLGFAIDFSPLGLRFQNGLRSLPPERQWLRLCSEGLSEALEAVDFLSNGGLGRVKGRYLGSVFLASNLAVIRDSWIRFTKFSTFSHSLSSSGSICVDVRVLLDASVLTPLAGDAGLCEVLASSRAFFHASKSRVFVALKCQISAPESIDMSLVLPLAPMAARDRGIAPRMAEVFRL